MPCPFGTSFYIVYNSLGEALALTATAPWNRLSLLQQLQLSGICVDDGTHLRQFWQGNLHSVLYMALLKAVSSYGVNRLQVLMKLSQSSSNKSVEGEDEKEQKILSVSKAKQRQQLQLLAGGLSLTLLYPLLKAVTVVTAMDKFSSGDLPSTVSSIITSTVEARGFPGLYHGLGSTLASYFQFQMSLQAFLLFGKTTTAKGNNGSKSSISHRWRCYLHRQLCIVGATCLSYPLETFSRRRQMEFPANSDGEVWAGLGYRLVQTILYHAFLDTYNSDACSIFVRRIAMKFFH